MKDIFFNRKKSDRSGLLDSLRGITVISMVLFHGMWDLYYLFDVNADGSGERLVLSGSS